MLNVLLRCLFFGSPCVVYVFMSQTIYFIIFKTSAKIVPWLIRMILTCKCRLAMSWTVCSVGIKAVPSGNDRLKLLRSPMHGVQGVQQARCNIIGNPYLYKQWVLLRLLSICDK